MDRSSFVNDVLQVVRSEQIASRRSIEAIVSKAANVTPIQIAKALSRLTERGEIVQAEIAGAYQYHVYHMPYIGGCDKSDYARLVEHAHEVASSKTLRKCGERYVRSALIQSGAYSKVTPLKNLGLVSLSQGCSFADMCATVKIRGPIRILIEVKNTHETFYPHKKLFGNLVRRAIENKCLPLLAAAHLSREAEDQCREVGIAVLHFRRQILPNSIPIYKRAILTMAFGPEPREFIEMDDRSITRFLARLISTSSTSPI